MNLDLLNQANVSPAIFEKYPTYVAHLLIVDGIKNHSSDEVSEKVVSGAENSARELLQTTAVDELNEVKEWREVFLSFGVKPRDGRSSFEALLRRVDKGLPRIDFLTDIYNALSVKYLLPIGGEDLAKYHGAPRLEFAIGDEKFDTTANGEAVVVNPEIGEVIWRDDFGVTCRRWNWRQCVRTRLGLDTKTALFIFDGLGDNAISKTESCATELINIIQSQWSDLNLESIVLSATS